VVFMVPLPLLIISGLSLNLKLLATEWSLGLLDISGVLAVQDGSRILFTNDSITVGNACSGLRSIISLLALGAVYAYVFWGERSEGESIWLHHLKKILLFLFSIPIAMTANILRIYFVGLVANWYGSEIATGTVHDISGYMVFVVALVLLYLAGLVLDRVIISRPKESSA
jgi:exosortase